MFGTDPLNKNLENILWSSSQRIFCIKEYYKRIYLCIKHENIKLAFTLITQNTLSKLTRKNVIHSDTKFLPSQTPGYSAPLLSSTKSNRYIVQYNRMQPDINHQPCSLRWEKNLIYNNGTKQTPLILLQRVHSRHVSFEMPHIPRTNSRSTAF